MYHRLALYTTALAALSLAGPVSAQSVADFYKGKTITLISGGSAGGGFSNVARTLGQFWEKNIPGNPKIIVDAKAGAGGATMMSYMANAAKKDGTELGAALPIAVNAPLLRKVKFNAADFQWLGSITPMTEVSSVWHTGPAKTIEEAKKVEVIMATSSKLSSAYLIPAFMNAVAGTKFKIVLGYRGAGPMNKAMEAGEVHGRGSFYNSYVTTKPDWIRDKKIHHFVQVGPNIPGLKNVPNMRDIVKTDLQNRIVDFMEAPAYVGFGYFAPRGVPADRVAALRDSFWKTVNDPKFRAEAKKRRMVVDPLKAEKVQAVINKAMATPPEVIAKFREMVKLK
jgi:tripartite-type tricarboxylate transporter receptor subunit TctC